MSGGTFPEIVDLRLLGQCDLACPFCFGPRHHHKVLPTGTLLRILALLRERGVLSVVFTGGEPCLVKDLPEILRYSKEIGLRTVLSTNGVLFRRRMAEIAPSLDWVGLPLDAASSSVNRMMRPGRPDQYAEVKSALSELRSRFPAVGVKLGTVACALNKDDLIRIPAVLGDIRPDIWKIYQVVYSTYAADNRGILELPDDEFEEVVAALQPVAAAWGPQLVIYRRATRPGRYLFIEPNGDAQAARLDDEVVIGNVLTDPDQVARVWASWVDADKVGENFRSTYPAADDPGHRVPDPGRVVG